MRSEKAKNVARLGMLFALAIALSFCESCLTPLLGLMPAMKLGLSNIVVMYALLYLSKRQALALVLLKALFALLTRGGLGRFSVFVRRAGFLGRFVPAAGSALFGHRLYLFCQRGTGAQCRPAVRRRRSFVRPYGAELRADPSGRRGGGRVFDLGSFPGCLPGARENRAGGAAGKSNSFLR